MKYYILNGVESTRVFTLELRLYDYRNIPQTLYQGPHRKTKSKQNINLVFFNNFKQMCFFQHYVFILKNKSVSPYPIQNGKNLFCCFHEHYLLYVDIIFLFSYFFFLRTLCEFDIKFKNSNKNHDCSMVRN